MRNRFKPLATLAAVLTGPTVTIILIVVGAPGTAGDAVTWWDEWLPYILGALGGWPLPFVGAWGVTVLGFVALAFSRRSPDRQEIADLASRVRSLEAVARGLSSLPSGSLPAVVADLRELALSEKQKIEINRVWYYLGEVKPALAIPNPEDDRNVPKIRQALEDLRKAAVVMDDGSGITGTRAVFGRHEDDLMAEVRAGLMSSRRKDVELVRRGYELIYRLSVDRDQELKGVIYRASRRLKAQDPSFSAD